MSGGAWVRLPLDVLKEQGVSKAGAVVLAIIIDKCTQYSTRSAPMGAGEIMQKSGYSRSTVFSCLKELERLDLIRHDRTGRVSCFELTRCVELYPEACQLKPRAKADAKTKSASKYEAMANRFPADQSAADQSEPLPGQLEFPVDRDPDPDPNPKPAYLGLRPDVYEALFHRKENEA